MTAPRVRRAKVSRLPAERRISDIMIAARAVFAEKGYQEALIADIAERAGVVEGSIYRFFANKRELLVRAVEDWYRDMLARDAERFAGVRGTWNQLRFVVWHHLISIRREPALSRLVLLELRADPDYRHTRVFELNQQYTRRLVAIVQAAIDSGEFRADAAPGLVRDMIYGCIEHRTWAYLRGEGDFDLDATADGITDLVYRGLVAHDRSRDAGGGDADGLAAATSRLERIAERMERMERKAQRKRLGTAEPSTRPPSPPGSARGPARKRSD